MRIFIWYLKSINNLLLIYPDKDENGISFWSGSRKKPHPLENINIYDKIAKQFLYSFCFIFAKCLGVAFNKKEFENNNKLEFEINEIFNSVKKKGNINEEKEKEKMDKIRDINEIKMIIENKNNFNWSIQ